jgi:ribosome biogenesis GTPase
MRGQKEVLAANVDLLVVVAAASPEPDWFIVDRYLSAAETMGVAAAVVYNKTDLDQDKGPTQSVLAEYRDIGYPVLRCSAKLDNGIDELLALLRDKSAIIVGQSGVGKSTLINKLTDSNQLPTAGVSEKSGEGRHTTVNSVMLQLPGGGSVIDSPGVRDYAPALSPLDKVSRGFREMDEKEQLCRFANCRHTREPNCAVKKAVDDGEISARRYESYRRLLNMAEQTAKKN